MSSTGATPMTSVSGMQGLRLLLPRESRDSEELMREMFRQSKAFFSLDPDDKMAVKADKNNRGYTPMHDETLDPSNQAKGDTKEGYNIFREIDAHGEEATKPLRGPNPWPSEDLLPEQGIWGFKARIRPTAVHDRWKATMKDYFDRMLDLGVRLSGLLAAGMGLDSSFFDGCFSESLSALRLLHYSSEVSDAKKGVLGTGAHSDDGLTTMLATGSLHPADEVPGLQVMLDGEWLDVPPRPGAFVCNLGDMLQRWTNDNLRSTTHRVFNKLGRERYSIPFFFIPNFDTEVVSVPQFCSEENPAKYPPVTSGVYLLEKFVQTFQDFKKGDQAEK